MDQRGFIATVHLRDSGAPPIVFLINVITHSRLSERLGFSLPDFYQETSAAAAATRFLQPA